MDYIQLQSPYSGSAFITGLVLACVGVFFIVLMIALLGNARGSVALAALALFLIGAAFIAGGCVTIQHHADDVGNRNIALFESSYGIRRDSILPAQGSRDPAYDISYGGISDIREMRVQGRKGVETKAYTIDRMNRLRLYNGFGTDGAPVKPAVKQPTPTS